MALIFLPFALLVLISGFHKSIAELVLMQNKNDGLIGFCDQPCQQEINKVIDYASSRHRDQSAKHDSLLRRIISLENEFYDALGRTNQLSVQVANLQVFLSGNVTSLNRRINDEVTKFLSLVNDEIKILQNNLYFSMNNLTSEMNIIKYNQNSENNNNKANSVAAIDVYYNLTKRIDDLQYRRLNSLMIDSKLWRQNFKVVNTTFEKINLKTNCVCRSYPMTKTKSEVNASLY